VIGPGAKYRDTLRVFAGTYGDKLHPQFQTEQVEGVYRLRWDQALSSFDPDRHPFGEELPLEFRVSNEFVLKGP
jgi:hypothetical protein